MSKWMIILSIILGLLVLAGVIVGTYFSAREPSGIQQNIYSANRMTSIHQVFTSYFGRNWPYMFLVFAILILVIMVLIYLLTRQGLTINISNANFVKLSKAFFWIAIILSLGVIALGVLAYVKYHKEQSEKMAQNGDFSDQTKGKQLIEVVGLGLILLIMLGAIGWYVYKYFKRGKK